MLEVLIAPRSPWQNPYVERVIGTLRRELLDHVIVVSEQHLRRLVQRYLDDYYHPARAIRARECQLRADGQLVWFGDVALGVDRRPSTRPWRPPARQRPATALPRACCSGQVELSIISGQGQVRKRPDEPTAAQLCLRPPPMRAS